MIIGKDGNNQKKLRFFDAMKIVEHSKNKQVALKN